VKYPALNPRVNLKSRVENILDVLSYADQLSPKELEWMNKFMEEYNGASFNKDNDKNLMKTTEEKRKVYNDNNSRNRDVYGRLEMNNDLVFIEDLNNKDLNKIEDDEEES
jgi:hypothetical protein